MSEVVAVYGGSFNPPHLGHVLVAAYVMSAHEIDRLIIVPAASHAFDKQLAPFADRRHMCELAMRHLQRVEVSDLEAKLGGVSRTLTSLEALQVQMPHAKLRLVIGSDLVPEFPTWHRSEDILSIAQLLVIQRSGHVTDSTQLAIPDVSSTEVRDRLAQGLDTLGKLCPLVAQYIKQRGLYVDLVKQDPQ